MFAGSKIAEFLSTLILVNADRRRRVTVYDLRIKSVGARMVRIRLPQSRHSISVHRDKAGVPHVDADGWDGTLYGLGFMHATDRGTQLLFARAVASGRAAELISDHPELTETDLFFRRLGLHLGLTEDVDALPADALPLIHAYYEGINHGLQSLGRTLPMWATGFQPEPWDVKSVLLVGRLLSFGGLAVGQYQNERLLLELIHARIPDDVLRTLFSPKLDGVDLELLRQVHLANQLSDEALELLTDLPRLAGSNAWAVSPDRSLTRSALLASDPHLEVNRLPGIWYECVLRHGSEYVLGATLPGCPLFAVARNSTLSWGVTYMKGDTVDFFIEDCRPGGATGWQYRRNTEWIDFRVREEQIRHKGNSSETVVVYENDVGPLECSPHQPGYYLSVAWSGNRPGSGRAIASWLNLLACRSVEEGLLVVRDCPQPSLCFVMADRDGHIGLQGCGTFPRRRKPTDGLLPLPAWDPANHWQGWLSTDCLPHIFDPPEEFIATANENVNLIGHPELVTQIVPDYRKRRIVEQLRNLPQATRADMQRLQHDVLSVQARDLLRVLLPLIPEGPLRGRLSNWDCRYNPESTDAALFQQFYVNVMMEMLGAEGAIGWRRMVHLATRAGYSSMILTAADRLLLHPELDWWKTRSLSGMVERAAKKVEQSAEIPWSEMNHFQFLDRFFGRTAVGRMLGYQSRRVAMPGTNATPFQGHVCQTATRTQTFAPSYHFVTDMHMDEAWTNLPGGPSESRFSRYYRNDLLLWLRGQYKRLLPDHRKSGRVDPTSHWAHRPSVPIPPSGPGLL